MILKKKGFKKSSTSNASNGCRMIELSRKFRPETSNPEWNLEVLVKPGAPGSASFNLRDRYNSA